MPGSRRCSGTPARRAPPTWAGWFWTRPPPAKWLLPRNSAGALAPRPQALARNGLDGADRQLRSQPATGPALRRGRLPETAAGALVGSAQRARAHHGRVGSHSLPPGASPARPGHRTPQTPGRYLRPSAWSARSPFQATARPAQTPREFGADARGALAGSFSPFAELPARVVALFYRSRFGGSPPTEVERATLDAELDRLTTALRRETAKVC